ncbi:MAG: GxxExxY protein [Bacteroidales bacterium]|nr:GxxExxY protein [Bacteroidales bacterium]
MGAVFQVHNTLGCGFSEKLYQDALEIEFLQRGIPFGREKRLVAFYRGYQLKHDFSVDFMCYGNIVVECKATQAIETFHRAQILNYMKVAASQVGLLINFGAPSLLFEPFIL